MNPESHNFQISCIFIFSVKKFHLFHSKLLQVEVQLMWTRAAEQINQQYYLLWNSLWFIDLSPHTLIWSQSGRSGDCIGRKYRFSHAFFPKFKNQSRFCNYDIEIWRRWIIRQDSGPDPCFWMQTPSLPDWYGLYNRIQDRTWFCDKGTWYLTICH